MLTVHLTFAFPELRLWTFFFDRRFPRQPRFHPSCSVLDLTPFCVSAYDVRSMWLIYADPVCFFARRFAFLAFRPFGTLLVLQHPDMDPALPRPTHDSSTIENP